MGAWGPMAGRTGTQWDDLTGRGVQGTFSGITANTGWVPSRLPRVPGNWIQQTGSADHISFGTPAHLANLFEGGGSVVVASRMETWGDNFPAFVGKQNSSATAGWILFGYNNSGEAQLRFRCEMSTGTELWRTSSNNVVLLGTPQIYAVSFDSTVSVAPTLCIDGVVQGVTGNAPTGTPGDDTAVDMRVGYGPNFNDFVGDIGLLLLFKPALSPAELQALCFDPLLPLRRRPRVWLRPSAAPAGRVTKNTRACPLGMAHGLGFRRGGLG